MSALQGQDAGPAALVAVTMEAARVTIDQGDTPNEAVKQRFLEALAHMIRNAMQVNSGDPAFQATVLEHHAQQVREYASLSAQSTQDRRLVLAAVNAVAHPAKLERSNSAEKRAVLSRLYEAASSQSWTTLHATAQHIIESPEIAGDSGLIHGVTQIRDGAALARLIRAEKLEPDQLVQHYRALREQNGPRSGSDAAAAQGRASKKRGAGVEALAAQALQNLADMLNLAEGSPDTYRIATSLRVPAVLMIDAQLSKAEWDVVLLRKAPKRDADDPIWNICLLVEAKASADAATTDFPRLLRGLQLLAQADGAAIYSFAAQEETVRLHGASLNALTTEQAELKGTVLYCTDAPAETMPRPLNPAGRMQLLTAPASLEFAGKWVGQHIEGIANKEANSPISDHADNTAATQKNNLPADLKILEPVWHELLESPRWRPVLRQYQTLRQVRELMVHPDDLISAISALSNGPQETP
ncbi:3-deoxy-D-arabino-heptulosonate 7-phosphate synthase [Pusillimonas sp.]|uniref:3-deoxy-D-arabino-heptulosonate 7-phosphate synthase n=1 Tax=Pusillimonas sp. TaxID=3040095 RepID=UPI0037CA8311